MYLQIIAFYHQHFGKVCMKSVQLSNQNMYYCVGRSILTADRTSAGSRSVIFCHVCLPIRYRLGRLLAVAASRALWTKRGWHWRAVPGTPVCAKNEYLLYVNCPKNNIKINTRFATFTACSRRCTCRYIELVIQVYRGGKKRKIFPVQRYAQYIIL